MLGFLSGDYLENMQPLNVIKDYYGEKMAFYFAWLTHYTSWLVPLSVIAVMYSIFTIIYRVEEDEAPLDELLNTPIGFIYGVIVVIWLTLINISWRRKQNTIANEWLVRNFKDMTLESETF